MNWVKSNELLKTIKYIYVYNAIQYNIDQSR